MAAAYCRHTRLGLAALRLFLRTNTAFAQELFVAGAKQPAQALGWLVFHCESATTDRTLDSLAAQLLRKHVQNVMLKHGGISNPAACDVLKERMLQLLPRLNAARTTVATSCNQLQLPGLPT